MRPSPFGTIAAFVVLAALSYVSARPVGPLPALGPLLDPVRGVWASDGAGSRGVSGLGESLAGDVDVVYDDRGVPHIFASSSTDAYRALGFAVARDRLFQIELQGRAGAGTITELAGARALSLDRATRASGMPRSARRRAAALDTTSRSFRLMRAYVDGVNAYIDALTPADYPIEYKLLGARPRRMQVIDVLHLLNRMGDMLASSRDELDHLAVASRVGRTAADALFPAHARIAEPIQPSGAGPRYDSTPLPPPGAPDTLALALLKNDPRVDRLAARGRHRNDLGTDLITAFGSAGARARSDDAIGSNNWAVSPKRSASNHALLAGDPHLELTLPSIWYESHLVVRDTLDVYGVGIPGLPGVVIGFNRAVAWTFTNTGADVADYYVETVDDATSPVRYELDGGWKPLDIDIERYLSPTGTVLAVDTLRFSHRGPVRRVGARWISMRWTVLEANNELGAFDAAARASSVAELQSAMARDFGAPAQNMLAADTSGAIAIRSTGRFPIRPGDGRGDWLRDGRTSANDWRGYWDPDEYPQSFDPAQGFLASANQEPVDSAARPRYLGSNWERPWRAMRINALLRRDSAVTPDAMRRYQTDPGSERANFFVPALVAAALATTTGGVGDKQAERAAGVLAAWDRAYTRDNRAAVLFEETMRQLTRLLWDELRDSARVGTGLDAPYPTDVMTATLMSAPASVWWDRRDTPVVETRDALITRALAMALDTTIARYGEVESAGWTWSAVRHANVRHLLGLPAFSRLEIPVQGGNATLWPSSGDGGHGPSWRMVVELSSPVRAWGIYPGGQSGDPMSPAYDDRLAKWRDGQLDTLRVPGTLNELPARARSGAMHFTRSAAVKRGAQ